jgi:hypothetical protein
MLKIPIRTSSKRSRNEVEDDIKDLENERDALGLRLKKSRKDLKPHGSFSSVYVYSEIPLEKTS